MDLTLLSAIGLILVLVGFAVAFIAVILLLSSSAKGKRGVKGGGAVVIGLFPIIFGTDKESVKTLLLLSILLVTLMFIFTAFFYFWSK